jgi:hypothetical protein
MEDDDYGRRDWYNVGQRTALLFGTWAVLRAESTAEPSDARRGCISMDIEAPGP